MVALQKNLVLILNKTLKYQIPKIISQLEASNEKF